MIKVPTCYKNPENPSCIDLILNKPRNFQNLFVIETSLSDFYKMTVTALRMQFRKLKSWLSFYIDYTKFSNEIFINSFEVTLDTWSISPDENGFLNFCKICTETLNKRNAIRRNQSSFISKEISKTIMKRTDLRNKFLIDKADEIRQAFVKQRNYCVSLLRKWKRNYYSNLDAKDITDIKKFWKTVKPRFFDKTKSAVSITLKDNNKIVERQNEVANNLIDFFSKIVSALQILESNNIDPQSERMSCHKLKSVIKYRRHPSITAIQNAFKGRSFFPFFLQGRNKYP